jgi:putative membrane protein
MYDHGWLMGWPGGWWVMLLSMIFWLLLLVGIVLLVIWLAGKPRESSVPREPQSPLDVLKMRYARGEITRDDYVRMKDELAS